MKTYDLLLNPKAAGELGKLPKETAEQIKGALKHLETNPINARSGVDVKCLAGTSDPKLYRLRIGKYRAIFWVDEEKSEVLVEKIALRKKAYLRV